MICGKSQVLFFASCSLGGVASYGVVNQLEQHSVTFKFIKEGLGVLVRHDD